METRYLSLLVVVGVVLVAAVFFSFFFLAFIRRYYIESVVTNHATITTYFGVKNCMIRIRNNITTCIVNREGRSFFRLTGIFSQSGVFNLNQRAEDVMDRLGVPVVQGYDITGGQSWATPPRDGR